MKPLARQQVDMHPDEETLAGFSERRLADGPRATLAAHLAACDECAAIVGAVAAESQGPARSVEIAFDVMRRKPARRWLVPAAAAAVIAIATAWFVTRTPATRVETPVVHEPEPKSPATDGSPAPSPQPQPEPRREPRPEPLTGPEAKDPVAPNPPPPEPPPEPPPPPSKTPAPSPQPPRRTYAWKPPALANIRGPLRAGTTDLAVACVLHPGDRLTSGDAPVSFQIIDSAAAVLLANTEIELALDGSDLRVDVRRGRALFAGRALRVNDRPLDGVLACTPESAAEGDAAEFARLGPRHALLFAATFDRDGEPCEPVSGVRESGRLSGRSTKSGAASPAAVWLRPAVAGTLLRAVARTSSRSIDVTLRTSTNRAVRATIAAPKNGLIEIPLPRDESIMEVSFAPSVDTKGAKPVIDVDAIEILGESAP